MLLDSGHPEARLYPLGMVWDESNIVIERRTSALINESNLMAQTISAALSKKGNTQRNKTIAKMNVHTVPFDPFEGPEEGSENGQS